MIVFLKTLIFMNGIDHICRSERSESASHCRRRSHYFSKNGDKLSCSSENVKTFLKIRIKIMSLHAERENPILAGQNKLPPFIDLQKPFRKDAK